MNPLAGMRRADRVPVLWDEFPQPVPYEQAMRTMQDAQRDIIEHTGREQIWLLSSPPGYSRGSRTDVLPAPTGGVMEDHAGIRNHAGGFWYHGPGVLGVVVLLDLRQRRRTLPGVAAAVRTWLARSVQAAGVAVHERADQSGLWATVVGEERKVAAVTLSVRRWVTSYGAGILVDPDMNAFTKINPCGLDPCVVTSLAALGLTDEARLRGAMRDEFHTIFGPTTDASRHR